MPWFLYRNETDYRCYLNFTGVRAAFTKKNFAQTHLTRAHKSSHTIQILEQVCFFIPIKMKTFSSIVKTIVLHWKSCRFYRVYAHKIRLKHTYTHTHTHMYIYTGWPILIHPVEYLENQARERKMFQTKVVWFRGGHKMVPLVLPWKVV